MISREVNSQSAIFSFEGLSDVNREIERATLSGCTKEMVTPYFR